MSDIAQSIFLGIIQGASEFLPISSSGHLILIPKIFNWEDQGLAFDVALHLGTLLAVIVYFWKDWLSIFNKSSLFNYFGKSKLQNPAPKQKTNILCIISNFKSDLLAIIFVSTIPGVISGLVLEKYAENVFRNPFLIAFTLSLGALLLLFSDRNGTKRLKIDNIGMKAGVIIGIAQAFAIIPGVSRSGITITAALLLGLDRTSAAKFSFLLSTPIIMGAGIKEFPVLIEQGIGMVFVAGIIFSFLSGYITIKYMIRYLNTKNYDIFVAYRIILAIFILIFFFSNF